MRNIVIASCSLFILATSFGVNVTGTAAAAPLNPFNVTIAELPGGGGGGGQDCPGYSQGIKIKTPADFLAIESNLNGDYFVCNNLDFSGITFNPIGDYLTPFTGSLDGNNKELRNITLSSNESQNGIFSKLNNALISRLTIRNAVAISNYGGVLAGVVDASVIEDIDLQGSNTCSSLHCGLLGGLVYSSVINNIRITGTLSSSSDYVGGLFGGVYRAAQISNVRAVADVTGHNYVGGIAGWVFGNNPANLISFDRSSFNGTVNGHSWLGGIIGATLEASSPITPVQISSCQSEGVVQGVGTAGGLAGYLAKQTRVDDSYSRATIRGSSWVGGLVGILGGTMTNSLANGAIQATGTHVGGIIGSDSGWGTTSVQASFFNSSLNPTLTDNQYNVGRSDLELRTFTNYENAGWDITKLTDGSNSTWKYFLGSFPVLAWELE